MAYRLLKKHLKQLAIKHGGKGRGLITEKVIIWLSLRLFLYLINKYLLCSWGHFDGTQSLVEEPSPNVPPFLDCLPNCGLVNF